MVGSRENEKEYCCIGNKVTWIVTVHGGKVKGDLADE